MSDRPVMLIVDDMEVNRELLAHTFCDSYEVMQAEDGIEALSMMRSHRKELSVVVLDIIMPHMNGLTVLQEVQKDEELKKIPIVVVTGDKDKDNEIKALDLGAADMLKKPYDMRVMQKRIANAVIRHEIDMLKEKNFRTALEQNGDERYRIMQEQTNTILLEMDSMLKVNYLSDSIRSQIQGNYKDISKLFWMWKEGQYIAERDMEAFEHFLQNISVAKKGATKRINIRFLTLHDKWEWYKIVATVVEGEKSKNKRIVITLNNINDEVVALEKIRYQAKYDELTGIYNKNTFYRSTEKLLKEKKEGLFALMRIDIERFKVINDLFGLSRGNHLLQFTAEAIKAYCMDKGTFGRLESDNFAACIPYEGEETLMEFWEQIGKAVMNYPIQFEIVVDIGAYVINDRNISIDLMCDRAKLALETIKGNYMKNYVIYNERLRENILGEQVIVNEMDFALTKQQFQIYLQPKYDLDTARPVGAEALVRWMHPSKGIISPGIFIRIFEKNGFISKLDYYVWEKTCQVLKEFQDENLPMLPISVNVSRMNLFNTELANELEALVNKYGLRPELLELELTESAYMENPEQLLLAMEQLQQKGFVILMDDFGSGYSSLNMLRNVPVDILKVDMEFLRGEDKYGKGRKILKSIVNMSKDVDLPTIIEGVETEEQVEFLKGIGCTQVQGYYYAKPMPVAEYKQLLLENVFVGI